MFGAGTGGIGPMMRKLKTKADMKAAEARAAQGGSDKFGSGENYGRGLGGSLRRMLDQITPGGLPGKSLVEQGGFISHRWTGINPRSNPATDDLRGRRNPLDPRRRPGGPRRRPRGRRAVQSVMSDG